jgi:hypothetical protein
MPAKPKITPASVPTIPTYRLAKTQHTTTFLPTQSESASLIADWEGHPAWTIAQQGLQDFHNWVSGVVLPIVFQWIEEHHDEVYKDMPEELKGDVGTVIAKAFKLVEPLDTYQRGLVESQKLEDLRKSGKLDIKGLNPEWAKKTRELREVLKKAPAGFDAKRKKRR